MKKTLLALIVILALASMTVGSTFAGFSDTDVAADNSLTTGSLDLKVAQADDAWEGDDFRDDEPYGVGLEPSFFIDECAEICKTESANHLLWNAGELPGTAYLHFLIDDDPQNIAPTSDITIWYDDNGNEAIDNGETITGTLGALACDFIELGPAPACEPRRLTLQIHPYKESVTQFSLTFRTEFALLLDGDGDFCDTETNLNYLASCSEVGGTPGFWHNPAALRLYGKDTIADWFRFIVSESEWFADFIPRITGDDDTDYNMLVDDILKNVGSAGYEGMVNQFRSQYMATLLNALSGRLDPATSHDVDIDTIVSATLEEIIIVIEDTAAGEIYAEPPSIGLVELMKDVCDDLNNLRI